MAVVLLLSALAAFVIAAFVMAGLAAQEQPNPRPRIDSSGRSY